MEGFKGGFRGTFSDFRGGSLRVLGWLKGDLECFKDFRVFVIFMAFLGPL